MNLKYDPFQVINLPMNKIKFLITISNKYKLIYSKYKQTSNFANCISWNFPKSFGIKQNLQKAKDKETRQIPHSPKQW